MTSKDLSDQTSARRHVPQTIRSPYATLQMGFWMVVIPGAIAIAMAQAAGSFRLWALLPAAAAGVMAVRSVRISVDIAAHEIVVRNLFTTRRVAYETPGLMLGRSRIWIPGPPPIGVRSSALEFRAPGMRPVRIQAALGGTKGLRPNETAIDRWRFLVAAVRACGVPASEDLVTLVAPTGS